MKFNYYHLTVVTTVAVLVLMGGCATAPKATVLTPVEAIAQAAANPTGISGTFEMSVRNTGLDRGVSFLNSEDDYRDQRCLSVAVTKAAMAAFHDRGVDPTIMFKGHVIRVTGTARRTTIYFTVDGRRTDKYYYQTHIQVNSPDQIALVP